MSVRHLAAFALSVFATVAVCTSFYKLGQLHEVRKQTDQVEALTTAVQQLGQATMKFVEAAKPCIPPTKFRIE